MNGRTALGAAFVLLAILAGALFLDRAQRLVPVYAAARDLPAGTSLESRDLMIIRVRLPASALRHYLQPRGGAAPPGRVLTAPVRRQALVPAELVLASSRDADLVELPVQVDPGDMAQGLRPGDRVQVLAAFTEGARRGVRSFCCPAPRSSGSSKTRPGSRAPARNEACSSGCPATGRRWWPPPSPRPGSSWSRRRASQLTRPWPAPRRAAPASPVPARNRWVRVRPTGSHPARVRWTRVRRARFRQVQVRPAQVRWAQVRWAQVRWARVRRGRSRRMRVLTVAVRGGERMKLRLVTAGGGAAWESALVQACQAGQVPAQVVHRCYDLGDLLAVAAAGQAEAAVVAAGTRWLDHDALARLNEAGLVVVGVAPAGDEASERRLRQLGLLQVASEGDPPDALVERAQAALAAEPGEEEASPPSPDQAATQLGRDARDGREARHVLVAVWGPKGAPGRTTVAVNLAFEAAAAGGEVLLADADTYGGAVAHATMHERHR